MNGEIRPGVHRPDWSVVTKPRARAALLARDHARVALHEKWSEPLEPTQDRAWRAVLELFAGAGRSPRLQEVGDECGCSVESLRTLVSQLQARDLLGLDVSGETILYAYTVTGQQSEHRIQLHGRELHAVCAIDALGIAGMFHTDTAIISRCRRCGNAISIGTAQGGKSLSYGDAVVWYDLAYDGCAATSCCRSIAFFCSLAELEQWLRAQEPPRAGYHLTLEEALEVGRALFEPVLATTQPT